MESRYRILTAGTDTDTGFHSGAGHDAQFAAYMLPATMIFVQSKDGLSHCEPEYSSPEHCTEGASVMLNAVLKADAR